MCAPFVSGTFSCIRFQRFLGIFRPGERSAPTAATGSEVLALLNEREKVAPAIPPVEVAAGGVEPFGTKDLVKPVRRIGCLAEEQHGHDAALDEPVCDAAQEKPTNALPVTTA